MSSLRGCHARRSIKLDAVLVAYAVALGARFRSAEPIHEFPDLDTSIATLLGVSNAGYLVNKAVPHSEPQPG